MANIWNKENLDKALAMRESGKKYREIGEYFHIKVNQARMVIKKAERLKIRGMEGLSVRSINCLKNAGIETTKEAVKAGIESGKLHYRNKIKNFGKKSFDELCEWVEIEKESARQRCPHCGQMIPRKR